jgi:hypothetical protein
MFIPAASWLKGVWLADQYPVPVMFLFLPVMFFSLPVMFLFLPVCRYAVEKERRRIEAIKNSKIVELRRAGVPGKYLAELEGSKASF